MVSEQRKLRRRLKQIYDIYRTALLNRKYYGSRLTTAKRYNLLMEVLIAIGTSSVVGGWTIWQGQVGKHFWAYVAGTAAVLAILKPILGFSKKIQKYTELFIGHGDVFYALKSVIADVEVEQTFSDDISKAYRNALDRFKKLAAIDDPRPKRKLLTKCQDEVMREIPASQLWMPKVGRTGNGS